MNKKIRFLLLVFFILGMLMACSQKASPTPEASLPTEAPGLGIALDPSERVIFQNGNEYLILEFLDDDLLHFELSGEETQTDLTQPLHTSPMILKTDYPGPSRLMTDGKGTFETAALKVQVDSSTLCLTAWDISREPALTLTNLCPVNLGKSKQGFSLTPESFTHAYGLGEALMKKESRRAIGLAVCAFLALSWAMRWLVGMAAELEMRSSLLLILQGRDWITMLSLLITSIHNAGTLRERHGM